MFLYTVSSHSSFGSCATHYETFPLEEDKRVQTPLSRSLKALELIFIFNTCGGEMYQHAVRIL